MRQGKAVTNKQEIEQMKRYLWHELPTAERDAVENRYFEDDRYFSDLVALDERLVESYACDNGALTAQERKRLARSLQFVPARRVKVARLQSLNKPKSPNRWPSWSDLAAATWQRLAQPPVARNAWACGAALLLLSLGYLAYDLRQAKRELTALQGKQAAQEAQVEALTRAPLQPRQPEAKPDISPNQNLQNLQQERHIPVRKQPPPVREQPQPTAKPSPATTASPAATPQPYRATVVRQAPNELARQTEIVLEAKEEQASAPVYTTRRGSSALAAPVKLAIPAEAGQVAVQLKLPLNAVAGGPFTVRLNGGALEAERVKPKGIGRLLVTLKKGELNTGITNTLTVCNRAKLVVGSYDFDVEQP